MSSRSDNKSELPEYFEVGQAIDHEDCFFDSVAQGLSQLKHDEEFSVNSLREACKDLAENNQHFKGKILEDAQCHRDPKIRVPVSDDELWQAYLRSIEYTSQDIEKLKLNDPSLYQLLTSSKYGSTLQAPIGGRPEIEGQMICTKYNIKLHIIDTSATDGVWLHRVVNEIESKSVKNPDYNDKTTVHIINKGNKHFDPVLKKTHEAGGLKYSLHGNDYQLKLLMLFALKSNNSEVAFRLATEMAEAGKFDDLVFRYTDSKGNIKYRFLQAKHRQHLGEENKIKFSDLKSNSDDNDFSLQKYYDSYLKCKQNNEFKNGADDFIICTNTDFDLEPSTTKKDNIHTKEGKIKLKNYLIEIKDKDEVLNFGGKRYKFSDDPSIRKKIISDLMPIKIQNDDNLSGFLDKLVFAVQQPSGEHLEQQIIETIGSEFNLINSTVFKAFFKFMTDWMKHRIKTSEKKGGGRACFLTHDDIKQFLTEEKQKIAGLGLISSTLVCEGKIEKFGVEFKEDIESFQKINDFLFKKEGGREKQILIVCSKSELLTEIKISQILKKTKRDSYIFSDLKSLSLLEGSSADPVSAFRSLGRDYLIIENLSILEEATENLLKNFYEIVKIELNSKHKKKIILISQPEQKDNFHDLFKNDECVEIIDDSDNKLDNLTSQSKDKIIETEITMFGEKSKLIVLASSDSKNDLYSYIYEDALTTLITSDSIVIGSKNKYEFDTYVDIPRTLTYQTNIDKKCLKENKKDLFAISGINIDDFSKLVPTNNRREFVDEDPAKDKGNPIRFIRLDNQRDINTYFDKICRDYEEYNIHLLEYKDSVLEWKQSHGSLIHLRKFVLKEDVQRKRNDDLTDSAVIAGEPGLGKSTLLTTYSIKADSLWNIRVNLKDEENHISNEYFDELRDVVKFLCNVVDPTKSKSSLIKSLLQYCLKQQGQVTLLLDGYDEIKDHRNKKKVVQLLKTLRTTRGKVLLTTRSYARSELEDALGIFAYTLNPFEEEEQKLFLQKFWIDRLKIKEQAQEEEIYKFTAQLLTHFHKLKLMKKEGLVGIVLQARMVAEIFQDGCKDYLEHKEFNFHNYRISNIFDLFERFVEYQYERYLKERMEISTKLDEGSQTSLSRSYTKAHGNFALKSLFSEEQIKELLRKNIFSREELKGIGLIKCFKDDGRTDFLHPTYAEYFVAYVVVVVLRKEENPSKYRAVYNFLLIQIFRDCNKVIRDFIESAVKKENNYRLKEKWEAIQACDLLGMKISKNTFILSGQQDNVLPLNELFHTFEKATPEDILEIRYFGSKKGHAYNYPPGKTTITSSDTNLIFDLFYSFEKEKDVKILQDTLDYLVKIQSNGGLLHVFGNQIILENIHKAIYHYLVEAKQQDILDPQFVKKIDKHESYAYMYNTDLNLLGKDILENEECRSLQTLLGDFVNPSDENQKEQCIESLKDLLIPNNVKALKDLPKLNNLYCLIDNSDSYKGVIKKISSYVNSNKRVQIIYKDRIVDFLQSLTIDKDAIDEAIKPLEFEESLQSFFIKITHHPNIIEDTKLSVNKIYIQEGNSHWLETQGILISRFLKILTLEMSERFINGLKMFFGPIHSRSICFNLIDTVLDMVKTEGIEGIPQINKLAFLKILTHFTNLRIKKFTVLSPNRLEALLTFIQYMLNKQYIYDSEVLPESIECLIVLREAGLKLINSDQKLLVLDPASEFQFGLSSDYKTQIVELIKWRRNNPDQPRGKFLEKSFEVLNTCVIPLNKLLLTFQKATLDCTLMMQKNNNSLTDRNLIYDLFYSSENEKDGLQSLFELLDNFINTYNENQKEKCVKSLKEFLIPINVNELKDLLNLTKLYYLLDHSNSYKGIIKKLSAYINYNENVQIIYKDSIIDLLKSIFTDKNIAIDEALKPLEFEKSIQFFFIDITHHPNIIEDTKLSINEIYKYENSQWLEKQGIVMSRFLKILTLEMSEAFISALDTSHGAIEDTRNICDNLVCHILDTVKTEGIEGLPQINKLAFLEILKYFTKFNKYKQLIPNRLENIFKFIEYMLNKPDIYEYEILSESIDYLLLLEEAGLKLISIDQELLILDPASEFQYELSSDCKTQIIELIKWRREHPDQIRSEFSKKCFEVLELNKVNLKRRISKSNFQEVKRLKVENVE